MPFIDELKKKAQEWAERRAEKLKQSPIYYFPGEFIQEFIQTTARVGSKIPILGKPIEIMGKGLGTAAAMPFVSKTQKEIEEKERETQNKLIELLRKSKTPEQKERIKTILKETTPTNLYEEILKEAPTEKQVIGAATELATLAGMGKLSKLAVPVKSKLIRYPLEIAKSGVITGTFTGAEEAMRKEATKEDILKQAKKGAKIGATVTAALIGAGELIPRASRLIGRQWQKAVKWAEKELTKEIPKGSEIEKTLATIGEETTFKQKVAQKVLGFEGFLSRVQTRLFDRFYPLKRIEQKIIENQGRQLKEYEKVYRDVRLLNSIADVKSEAQILDLLNKYGSLDEVAKKKALAYITQLDYIERAKLGLDVPKGQTLEQLQEGLKKIIEEIGDDMPKVEEFRRTLQNHFVNLLNERVEAGVISKELRDKLLATHPNYIPHKVLIDIDEKAYQFIKDSFNVPHSDIVRAIGSTKNIENPLVASINKTIIANRVIEKNKLLNNLAQTLLENPDLFSGVREISRDAVVPAGFGKINYLANGEVKTLMVPKDLEVAIKNIDKPLSPSWFRFLTAPQRIIKKFATQLNPSFAVPNKFRDMQTSAITSASFIEEAAKKYGLNPLGVDIDKLRPEEILKLYRESGGWGANIFQEGDTEYIFSKLTKTVITKKLGNLNPLEFFEKINDSIETSTRLEVFKTALKQGLNPKDAALVARNATIDFSKMGSWMEPLNRAIPFLNARVQGFVNIGSSLFKNPEVFARTINWITTYPTILLHAHNRRFETYGKISQYIKNRYWVIMTGETDGIDPYTGEAIKVPQFITIPKSEGQQMIASPIQWYLEREDKTDYRKINEMIADVIGEVSPMWFQSWSSQNLFLSLASQMGPVVSVPVGLASGKSPFYGTPIVPPEKEKAPPYLQYFRTTPRILRWATEKLAAAKILNVSPAKIDFVLGSMGGLVEDFVDALDVVFGKVTKKPSIKPSISETPFGTATQFPVLRRFLREATGYKSSEQIYREKQKQKIEEIVTASKVKEKEKAEEIWQELIKKKTPEEKFEYLRTLRDRGELTPEIFERLNTIKRTRMTVEELKPTDPVEVRALYIYQRLREIENPEERFEFLKELRDKKILTEKVFQYLTALAQIPQ